MFTKTLPSLFLAIAGISGVVIVWQLKQPTTLSAPAPTPSQPALTKASHSPKVRHSGQSSSSSPSVSPSQQRIAALPMQTNTVAANISARSRNFDQAPRNRPAAPAKAPSPPRSSTSGSPSSAGPTQTASSSATGPVPVAQYEEVTEYSQPPLAYSIPPERSQGLPPVEQAALGVAQESFDKRLTEYGPLDPSSEEYFYAYQESAQASNDFLRAYLGWDRFMSLSAESIQQTTEQLAGGRGTATP